MTPTLYNALLRCTRSDQLAGSVFELTREDLGLWIFELGEGQGPLIEGISSIFEALKPHRALLKQLSSGSKDYTLHITFSGEESARVILPVPLLELAAYCGFEIEIYRFD